MWVRVAITFLLLLLPTALHAQAEPEQQLAGRRGRIEGLLIQIEIDAHCLEVLDRIEQVDQRPTDPITTSNLRRLASLSFNPGVRQPMLHASASLCGSGRPHPSAERSDEVVNYCPHAPAKGIVAGSSVGPLRGRHRTPPQICAAASALRTG